MNKYNRDKHLYLNKNIIKYILKESDLDNKQQLKLPKLVSSRGILNSCNIKSSSPTSSIHNLINYNFSLIKDKSTVYICTSAIYSFIKILPTIKSNIIL